MVVLIDTNIILDMLEKREPFYEASRKILFYCASKKITGYVAPHSISNIFFILRKHFSAADRRTLLLGIVNILSVTTITHETIKRALNRNDFPDFEDCLQDECAWEIMAEYLVTRNTNDFLSSKVSAISPDDFLQQFSF